MHGENGFDQYHEHYSWPFTCEKHRTRILGIRALNF